MKRIEDQLRQSREDLDRAQAVGQVGSWRLDVRENVLAWSDENYRIFGLPIGTPLTYETFLSVVHQDDRAFVDAKWQAGLRGEPYDIEHRLLVDGRVKWVREKAFLEHDEAGELLGGFGITQDVTERRLAEQALREREERLRLATSAGNLGVFEWDVPSDAAQWENERMYEIFGRTREEGTLGREAFYAEALEPADRETFDRALEAAMRPGALFNVACRIRRRNDGRQRWIEYSGRFDLAPGGSAKRLVGVIADVTERRATEEALRQSEAERAAQHERARLARDLHDSVSQAIFAATMKAEALLRSSDALPTRDADTLEQVRRLSRGALAQMRMLLWELRGEPLHEIPLPELLGHLVEAAESRTGAGIELRLEVGGELSPELHVALYRIAQEALNNVARHAQAKHAWVRVAGTGSRGRLVVGDDGCGFDRGVVKAGHVGLSSMRERAAETGVDLSIETAVGRGTVVTAEWRAGGQER